MHKKSSNYELQSMHKKKTFKLQIKKKCKNIHIRKKSHIKAFQFAGRFCEWNPRKSF